MNDILLFFYAGVVVKRCFQRQQPVTNSHPEALLFRDKRRHQTRSTEPKDSFNIILCCRDTPLTIILFGKYYSIAQPRLPACDLLNKSLHTTGVTVPPHILTIVPYSKLMTYPLIQCPKQISHGGIIGYCRVLGGTLVWRRDGASRSWPIAVPMVLDGGRRKIRRLIWPSMAFIRVEGSSD